MSDYNNVPDPTLNPEVVYSPEPVPFIPPAMPPKKSNKTVWTIVIVVLVLLCCCCAAVVFLAIRANNQGWFNSIQTGYSLLYLLI